MAGCDVCQRDLGRTRTTCVWPLQVGEGAGKGGGDGEEGKMLTNVTFATPTSTRGKNSRVVKL